MVIARNNHITVPYRSTNTVVVHRAVSIASILSGFEPLSLLLAFCLYNLLYRIFTKKTVDLQLNVNRISCQCYTILTFPF